MPAHFLRLRDFGPWQLLFLWHWWHWRAHSAISFRHNCKFEHCEGSDDTIHGDRDVQRRVDTRPDRFGHLDLVKYGRCDDHRRRAGHGGCSGDRDDSSRLRRDQQICDGAGDCGRASFDCRDPSKSDHREGVDATIHRDGNFRG